MVWEIMTAINYCLLGGSSIFHPTSGPILAEAVPSHAEQAQLFDYLLFEFLGIEDISDRVERTGELRPIWSLVRCRSCLEFGPRFVVGRARFRLPGECFQTIGPGEE
jgi:hypothetical protein